GPPAPFVSPASHRRWLAWETPEQAGLRRVIGGQAPCGAAAVTAGIGGIPVTFMLAVTYQGSRAISKKVPNGDWQRKAGRTPRQARRAVALHQAEGHPSAATKPSPTPSRLAAPKATSAPAAPCPRTPVAPSMSLARLALTFFRKKPFGQNIEGLSHMV